jgi:hypothetical protein
MGRQLLPSPTNNLTVEQIGLSGIVLERTLKSKNMFESIFSKMGDMIVELTSNEVHS